MAYIETIGRELAEALKRYNADYIEARLEESQTSHITYRGRELESIGRSTAAGGNVRALVRGGWGFVSFNDLSEIQGRVETAVKQAKSVGSEESERILVSWARMKARLESRNYDDLEFTTLMFEGENHTSGIPATYSRALRVLYGR